MSGVAARDLVVEELSSSVFMALRRILADDRITVAEALELYDLAQTQGQVVRGIEKCRLNRRVAEQVQDLGFEHAPNKHLLADLRDFQRREALWDIEAARCECELGNRKGAMRRNMAAGIG